jgi:carboxylesterase type B
VQRLRDVSLRVVASHEYNTSTFTWGPVIDDEFLSKSMSEVFKSGKLNAEMVMTSYNLHEGENFVPPGFASVSGSGGFNSSTASFDAWLEGFLPGLDSEEIEEVKMLYPGTGTAEEITWNTTYERAGIIYRDLVLVCPAYWLASKASKGYLVEYTISPARHASDTIYVSAVLLVWGFERLTMAIAVEYYQFCSAIRSSCV